jgi:hypothetical protein
MAYDASLAARVRAALDGESGLVEQPMFGGISFMLDGNFGVGVLQDNLVVRLSKDGGEGALEEPHVRPMDFTGRPMRGWLYVGAEATASDDALEEWVARSVAYARSLPPKAKVEGGMKPRAKRASSSGTRGRPTS